MLDAVEVSLRLTSKASMSVVIVKDRPKDRPRCSHVRDLAKFVDNDPIVVYNLSLQLKPKLSSTAGVMAGGSFVQRRQSLAELGIRMCRREDSGHSRQKRVGHVDVVI